MDNAADSKARILSAAKELFSKKGFEGTSTREIVNAAGVNIALISYHFGGKENVLLALFDHFLEDICPNGPAAADSALIDEVRSILGRIIRLRFEDPELINILHYEFVLKSSRFDKIKVSLVPVWTRMKLLLEEGKRRGVFSFESTENALFFAMSVAIFPRQDPSFEKITAEQPDIERTLNELLGFILKGLAADPPQADQSVRNQQKEKPPL